MASRHRDLAATGDAGETYARGLPLEVRRNTGTIYTPSHLVRLVLDLACYTPREPIEQRRLLDPACGGGAFLSEATRRLATRLTGLGLRLETPRGKRRFLATVESSLRGIDIDATACVLCVEAVRSTVAELLGGGQLPGDFFGSNIRHADFLAAPPADLFRPAESSYDLIFGNPPYVTTSRLSTREKQQLRQRYVGAHGRIDLYTLFIERSLELLAPGGVLAFITPDKFLTSQSARPLRELVASLAPVERIARFRSHRVFDGAATVPCITVFRRRATPKSVEVLECGEQPSEDGTIPIRSRSIISDTGRSGEPWHFTQPALGRLAHKIRDGHPTLLAVTSRISAGIATGRDRIFVVPDTLATELEGELLHPAVRGQDLLPYKIRESHLKILVPYVENKKSGPELIDLQRFPRARAYLEQFRGELEMRHCVCRWGKSWFDLHDPWRSDLTNTRKILLPDVTNSNRFAYDPGQHCPLHSTYYLVPKGIDPLFLTALLNSKPIEFLMRLYAPTVKDGFSRYRRQFLSTLPVPLVDLGGGRRIICAAEQGQAEAVDELIARVFGLSREQRSQVDAFLDHPSQRPLQTAA